MFQLLKIWLLQLRNWKACQLVQILRAELPWTCRCLAVANQFPFTRRTLWVGNPWKLHVRHVRVTAAPTACSAPPSTPTTSETFQVLMHVLDEFLDVLKGIMTVRRSGVGSIGRLASRASFCASPGWIARLASRASLAVPKALLAAQTSAPAMGGPNASLAGAALAWPASGGPTVSGAAPLSLSKYHASNYSSSSAMPRSSADEVRSSRD